MTRHGEFLWKNDAGSLGRPMFSLERSGLGHSFTFAPPLPPSPKFSEQHARSWLHRRTPYVISQFFFTCHQGQYVLLLFLLVEASTIPLNAMAFLEDLGRRRTLEHR